MRGPLFADLNDVILLMHIVDLGGYSAAARVLQLPKSTISQRISALESAVGAGLLRRSSRTFSLTEAGRTLLPYARAINEQAKQAEQRMAHLDSGFSGTITISTSPALARFALNPLIAPFLLKHPGVTIRMDVTNRYVDLIGEGYDLCVRAHGSSMKDSTLRQRVLAKTEWSLAASPLWITKHRAISKPADLIGHSTLHFVSLLEKPLWVLRKSHAEFKLLLTPRLVSDDMDTLIAAAIDGVGVTALPTFLLAEELASGRLVTVLPGWRMLLSAISILTPSKRQSSRLATAFSDYLADEFGPRMNAFRY